MTYKKTENMTRSHSRRHSGSRRRFQTARRDGVTMVEFAVVANVMFLMIFTCIEFARINMVRNMAQDAAYYAARAVMVPGATREEAEQEVERLLGSLLASGYEVNVEDFGNESDEIVVNIEVDLNAVALITPIFFKDKTLSTTARLRTERYTGFFRQ